MDYINDLHELCETLSSEVADVNDKVRTAGGKLTAGDVDYIDKLTHAIKSIKAVISMDDGEYSGSDYPRYRGRSYARGRYARRDDMGRYSRTGDLVDQLHELMKDAPNDQIRHEMQKLAEKIER